MINITTSILLILSSMVASDWGANGHRIIGNICDTHLTDKAKTEVEKILGKDYLAEISTWPDYIRSERQWKFADPWHYTTIHSDQSVEDVKNKYQKDSTINDAIEAIELMKDVLSGDEKATRFLESQMNKTRARPLHNSTKATALAFLVHIVGDIHQPLHVGKNKDLGGNKITVLFFSEKTNIHSVWDSKIIDHENLSYTEFSHFIDKLSTEEIAKYQSHSIDEWAMESIELREDIYNTIYDFTDRDTGLPSFSWQYQHDYIKVVEKRLVQAGVRLAGILNELYK